MLVSWLVAPRGGVSVPPAAPARTGRNPRTGAVESKNVLVSFSLAFYLTVHSAPTWISRVSRRRSRTKRTDSHFYSSPRFSVIYRTITFVRFLKREGWFKIGVGSEAVP